MNFMALCINLITQMALCSSFGNLLLLERNLRTRADSHTAFSANSWPQQRLFPTQRTAVWLVHACMFRVYLQACSQDRSWGGAGPPKSGPFGPHPLNLPTNTPFFIHFVAKSGPFGRFGVARRTPWLRADICHLDLYVRACVFMWVCTLTPRLLACQAVLASPQISFHQ